MDKYQAVIEAYAGNGNEQDAKRMQQHEPFMFLGLRLRERKALTKEFLGAIGKREPIERSWVLELWNNPYREYQYLAIDYLYHRRKFLLERDMELVELLMLTKPGKDTVDLLASQIVGEMCSKYPSLVEEYILRWGNGQNKWLVRAALLHQLKYKKATNAQLLRDMVLVNRKDLDILIRDGIGRALGEYGKTNPQWVQDFLAAVPLSTLSTKEARKYC